jgi:hypothetical protein
MTTNELLERIEHVVQCNKEIISELELIEKHIIPCNAKYIATQVEVALESAENSLLGKEYRRTHRKEGEA